MCALVLLDFAVAFGNFGLNFSYYSFRSLRLTLNEVHNSTLEGGM